MKKILTLGIILICSSFIIAQQQYELKTIQLCKGGESEIISVKVPSLPVNSELIGFDSLNMSYAGGWSLGQSFTIAASPTGDTVFIGAGAGVIIMDATDPYNPVEISQVHARALVDAIQYSPADGKLYLSAYHSGLEVWDVTDIQSPYRISRAGTSGLPRAGVYVPPASPGENPFAYLVTVADGIDVFELEEGNNPVLVNNQSFTPSLVWSSFGSDNLLFISTGSTGTKAIDLTDPLLLTNPFNVPGNSTSISARNNFLYVISSNSGLSIHDYSVIPTSLAGQLTVTGYPYRVSVNDSYAFIANSTTNPGGGVNVIDISDPSTLEQTGDYGGYQTFIASGETATYSTGGMEGCLFLDISDPEDPQYAANVELPVSTNDIAVQGDYAYSGSNGFRVYDISDKSKPVQVGYNNDVQGALVEVNGNTAVFCPKSMGSSNMVSFLDISEPTNPVKVGHYISPYMTYDLDLKGNYAFVACWWDGFKVIDYSDPSSPSVVAHEYGWTNGAIPGEEFCYVQALDVIDNLLYVVDYGPFEDEDTKGIYIFDVSDPENPVFIHRMLDFQGKPYDIHVWGGHAYLADSEGGLTIIDVFDNTNPFQVSYLPLIDVAWAVDVFYHHAFIANYINGGVQVVNVLDPSNPFIEGYYKQSGCFALNVTYNAGHAFVADGPAGIQIYNFDFLNDIENSKITDKSNIKVYPNPANDYIFISSGSDIENLKTISIFDLSGKIVLRSILNGNLSNKPVNVSSLKKGIYLIELSSENISEFTKIIIQ